MSLPLYNHGIYLSGTDPIAQGMSPDDWIDLKVGQATNSPEGRAQRLGERQRQVPGAIEHAFHPTHEGDARIRKHLCTNYSRQFFSHRGKGHDVIRLRVKDLPFLLEQAKRYFNAVNAGKPIGKAKLLDFPLRAEQQACLDKTIVFMSDLLNLGLEFLWDAKMRFGKTHAAYQLIAKMDFGLVLILTGRPTDTKQSWIDAMDHVDYDFGSDNFIDASRQTTPIIPDPNKRTIIFASLQDFARMTEEGFKEKFSRFPTLNFDLVIKDECHLAFDTQKTKEALSRIHYKHALNLSGTPFRYLLEERFPDHAKFTWSYLSEQAARSAELASLGQDRAEKEGRYYWLCPMRIFTILLSSDLYEDADLFTEEEGFTFTKLFATAEKNGKVIFRNDTAVARFVDAMCHGLVMPYSNQAHNSFQYASINLRHTLWYVPGVQEAKLLRVMLEKHKAFKQYRIIDATSDNGGEGNDTVRLVTSEIARVESGADLKHKGTITLSCGKLSHGVSIPEWGAVFNLSDMKSAQLYFQLMFRGQTEWSPKSENPGEKHECYVFDFNPNRTLTHLHALAKATVPTGDPKPTLTEMLNVFNVLVYEKNEFNQLDASDLISKLEAGFGRATSLTGLQNLLAELPFELDPDLCEGLADIEDGLWSKAKELNVNSNNTPNGKNSRRLPNGGGGGDDDSDNEEESTEDQQRLRAKMALRAVPLYFLLSRDESFDSLISNLDVGINAAMCKAVTGLHGRSLKKILSAQPQEKKQVINQGLIRFRSMEAKEHQAFQDRLASS